ncbi:MAG: murein biosynthesis integral membrane protein MurJ [Candidatus Obscuribacterales bacterium]|nr:murein biosynthesis integral membrane protein MurJ [Candidatus Obscuribacterales bacterium]
MPEDDRLESDKDGQEDGQDIREKQATTDLNACDKNETGSVETVSSNSSSKGSKREGLGRTFGLVAALTFGSKFIGLIRDIVILQAFGTSRITDAYYYSYMVTGNFLVLFGGMGGPFHSSAVSVMASRKDAPAIRQLIGQVLLFTTIVLCLLMVLVYLLAPFVIPAFNLNADPNEVLADLNIMLPMIVITGLVGVGAGISNTFKEFFWPSLAPAVASVAIIVAVLLYPETGGICLAVGTLLGAIGQFLVQLPGIMKSNPGFPSLTRFETGVKEYFLMLGPAAISTSIGQLNVYVDVFFMSNLAQGSYTALLNANKLLQLPLGVLVVSMIVPLLPRFTEQVAAGEIDQLKDQFRRALRVLWFMVLPLVTLMLAMPIPIVSLLFQRGQFNEESTMLVVLALSYLIPSAFFYVARDILTRVFYAHQDSTTPFRIGLASLAVKALADWLLVGPLGLGGIALSTTIVTIFNMTLLAYHARKKIGSLGISSLFKPAGIMIGASAVCGAAAYYTQILIADNLSLKGTAGAFAVLLISIFSGAAIGLAIYLGICLLLKLEEPSIALARIKKRLT